MLIAILFLLLNVLMDFIMPLWSIGAFVILAWISLFHGLVIDIPRRRFRGDPKFQDDPQPSDKNFLQFLQTEQTSGASDPNMTSYRAIIGLLSICLLLFVASCNEHTGNYTSVTDAASAAQDVDRADQLYAQRDDLMQLRRGVVSLRQALTKDPGNYEAAWKLSKFNYYLGAHTKNSEERDDAFKAGIEAGKTAVQLQNDKPDGHFWLGANYGGAAEHSTIQGLATVSDIRTQMETVLRLDEDYQNGSAYMVLGLVYLNAPNLFGGDPQKAVEVMEKGLEFGEPNALLHLHLAEAYERVGRDNDAHSEIKKILSMTPDSNYLPEYKEASAEAQKLLEKLSES